MTGTRESAPIERGTADSGAHYHAFISYRWGEPSQAWARWIHRTLEQYRVPRPFRRDGQARIRPVFIDALELSAGGSLTEHLRDALDRSKHLIVVCSAATPQSAYVRKEVEHFCRLDADGEKLARVSALLVEGDIGNFPVDHYGEPMAADVRQLASHPWMPGRKAAPGMNACLPSCFRLSCIRRRHEARLRIAAAVLGCGFAELHRRHRRQRNRRLVAGAALASVLVLAGISQVLVPIFATRVEARLTAATLTLTDAEGLREDVRRLITASRWLRPLLPSALLHEKLATIRSKSAVGIEGRELSIDLGRVTRRPAAVADSSGRSVAILTDTELIYVRDTDPDLTPSRRIIRRLPVGQVRAWHASFSTEMHRALVIEETERYLAATLHDMAAQPPSSSRHQVPLRAPVIDAAVSPTLERVALVTSDGLYDWAPGASEPKPLLRERFERAKVSFSPDGSRVMVVANTRAFIPSSSMAVDVQNENSVVFVPGTDYLAFIPWENATRVRFRNLRSATDDGDAQAGGEIRRIAYSPDGTTLVAVADDRLFHWNRPALSKDAPTTVTGQPAFSGIGEIALVGPDAALLSRKEPAAWLIEFLPFSDRRRPPALSGFPGRILALLPGTLRHLVLTTGSDDPPNGRARLYVVRTTLPSPRWQVPQSQEIAAAALADSGTVAYAYVLRPDGVVVCGGPPACPDAPTLDLPRVESIELSSDGDWLAAVSKQADGKRKLTISQGFGTDQIATHQIASSDGITFAVGRAGAHVWSADGSAVLNVAATDAATPAICPLPAAGNVAALDDTAEHVAIALEDRTIRIGRMRDGCPAWVRTLRLPVDAGRLEHLRFSGDGALLLAVDPSTPRGHNRIWIYDLDAWWRPLRARVDWPSLKDVRVRSKDSPLTLLASPANGGLSLNEWHWYR